MGKIRDRETSSPCTSGGSGWIEIKSLLVIAMLVLGIILLIAEIVLRYNSRTACYLPQLKNSMGSLSMEEEGKERITRGHEGDKIEMISQEKEENCMGSLSMEEEGKEIITRDDEEVISEEKEEKVGDLRVIKREFRAVGSAASVFVEFGAYRGGDDSFAVVGLGSKPLHVYGEAGFECEWEPVSGRRVRGRADKMLPDWGYGRVYTVVVVNCTFGEAVGVGGEGGRLILRATWSGADVEKFVALEEQKGSYAASSAHYRHPPTYDFLYCGSSLFGDLSPQRIREWLAYHVRLLGPRSHFVFHDAGGVGPRVRQVLLPWQKRGFVTLHDITQQAKFDGYYYNQFLVVNDCLHRTRFLANWTFFFDVDEYLYIPPQETLHSVMRSFSNYTQITFEQSRMSSKLCQASHIDNSTQSWGFEKLIYRNIKKGFHWDRKYAIQAKNVFATGVHMSENMVGKTLHTKGPTIKYYHYHNTITTKESDLCKELVNTTSTKVIVYSDHDPFKVDLGLQYFTKDIKDFELQQIGPQPLLS